MARKNRKNHDAPEGMSRRQAKLARRAAERAALEGEARPYEGFKAEADLVALQEFVPSAVAETQLTNTDRDVRIVTVLPGAAAALVRETEGKQEGFVALQQQHRSSRPARDLAYALQWVSQANAGDVLGGGAPADAEVPALDHFLPRDAELTITVHENVNWWLTEEEASNAAITANLRAANDAIQPSYRVEADVPGSLWWVNPGGGKAHIRWVRTEDESDLLPALARVAADGELNLGEGTKFAGVFRTHGLIVPVFDLDPEVSHDAYGEELVRVNKALDAALADKEGSAQLSVEARKQLQNIKSRQVTLR